MTLIEVIDTAVKIGLGAVISGIAGHMLAKNSHVRDLKKISFIRRQEKIESITEKAEMHFAAWRRLCSTLGGIFGGQNPPNPEFSEAHWKGIKQRDDLFIETAENLGQAIAILRLIDAQDAANQLKEFISCVKDFRDQMILQKKTPDREDFNSVRTKSSANIRSFYDALSKVYVSIPD